MWTDGLPACGTPLRQHVSICTSEPSHLLVSRDAPGFGLRIGVPMMPLTHETRWQANAECVRAGQAGGAQGTCKACCSSQAGAVRHQHAHGAQVSGSAGCAVCPHSCISMGIIIGLLKARYIADGLHSTACARRLAGSMPVCTHAELAHPQQSYARASVCPALRMHACTQAHTP